MPIAEIAIELLHPLVTIIVLLAGNKLVIEKAILKKVAKIIDPVVKKQDELIVTSSALSEFFEIGKTNKEDIRKMNKIKTYYVDRFTVDTYKNFALFKADMFINSIEKILETCELGIDCIDEIINTFCSVYATTQSEMYERLPKEYKYILQRT